MSDLFNIYEDTFNIVINRVNKIIDSMSNLSKEKSEQALAEANDNLSEAQRYLKQMELESDANFGKNSDRLKLKIRNYKNEFEMVNRRFLKQQETYVNNKSADASFFVENNSKFSKQRLIDNEELAYETSEKLERAKRTTMQMENSGIEVMKNMNHQTKQMESIDARVMGINSNMDDNQDIIEEMMKRDQRTKYVILTVAIILVSMLALIIGVRVFADGDKALEIKKL
jgi:hypothetical protein